MYSEAPPSDQNYFRSNFNGVKIANNVYKRLEIDEKRQSNTYMKPMLGYRLRWHQTYLETPLIAAKTFKNEGWRYWTENVECNYYTKPANINVQKFTSLKLVLRTTDMMHVKLQI
jgi:hypothetical protein